MFEQDQLGRQVQLGTIPSVGTRLIILGNEWRVCYRRTNPVSITLELSKKYSDQQAQNQESQTTLTNG